MPIPSAPVAPSASCRGRDDVASAEVASYCLHAPSAGCSLPSHATVRFGGAAAKGIAISRSRPRWPSWPEHTITPSASGIPPLAGFAGKLALFAATIDAGLGWLALVAVLNTVLSLGYYLRVIAPLFHGHTDRPIYRLGRSSVCAAGLAGAAVLIIGIGAGILFPGSGSAMLP